MLCHVVPCCLCYAMLWYVVLFGCTMFCYVVLYSTILIDAVLFSAMLGYVDVWQTVRRIYISSLELKRVKEL